MKVNDVTLRTFLYTKGLTQTELAKRAGFSRAYIGRICTGHTCSETTAQKIADALGVALEELKA